MKIQDRRGVCEEALLKVKGVISFTFQMAIKRCTVRVRADLPTEVDVRFHPLLNWRKFHLFYLFINQIVWLSSLLTCLKFSKTVKVHPVSHSESGIGHSCHESAFSSAGGEEWEWRGGRCCGFDDLWVKSCCKAHIGARLLKFFYLENPCHAQSDGSPTLDAHDQACLAQHTWNHFFPLLPHWLNTFVLVSPACPLLH